ncbi:hypothetical protein AAFF_G00212870 [Aldrovandia affinis]|uniref:Uncharacterized protein n=1 Tax=Aldrovandia affinis TaxID=143900 RepID=A0AAD7W5C5_9TELE|nr:hypothetical protein AAFF_G00212870 [Aldrovandia affinis]
MFLLRHMRRAARRAKEEGRRGRRPIARRLRLGATATVASHRGSWCGDAPAHRGVTPGEAWRVARARQSVDSHEHEFTEGPRLHGNVRPSRDGFISGVPRRAHPGFAAAQKLPVICRVATFPCSAALSSLERN